jgi:hypothetical protein
MSNNGDTFANDGTTDETRSGDVGATGSGGSSTGSNYTPGPMESASEPGGGGGSGTSNVPDELARTAMPGDVAGMVMPGDLAGTAGEGNPTGVGGPDSGGAMGAGGATTVDTLGEQ